MSLQPIARRALGSVPASSPSAPPTLSPRYPPPASAISTALAGRSSIWSSSSHRPYSSVSTSSRARSTADPVKQARRLVSSSPVQLADKAGQSVAQRAVAAANVDSQKREITQAKNERVVHEALQTEHGRAQLFNMNISATVYYYPIPWYKGDWASQILSERVQMAFAAWQATTQEIQRSILGRTDDELKTLIFSPFEYWRRRKARQVVTAELEEVFYRFRPEQIRSTDRRAIATVATGPAKYTMDSKALDPTRKRSLWSEATWKVEKRNAAPKLITLMRNTIMPGSNWFFRHALVRFNITETFTVGGKEHRQPLQTTVSFEQKRYGDDQVWKVKQVGVPRDPHGADLAHQT